MYKNISRKFISNHLSIIIYLFNAVILMENLRNGCGMNLNMAKCFMQ